MRITSQRKYGWIPQLPDHRDIPFMAKPEIVEALPPEVDLRGLCPPVYDQGDLGSCVLNAIAGAHEFDQMKQGYTPFMPSRLFMYFNVRVQEHTVNSDSGASVRDGIKTVNKKGVCPETMWGYDIAKFKVKPPHIAYKEAKKHQSLEYNSILQHSNQMWVCLASGFPFIFGFSVYESFESDEVAKTGIVPMPSKDERVQGGHAVLCCGYSDVTGRFIVRNSWGSDWGLGGYCEMPYEYLTNENLASDFWVIKVIE